MMNRARLTQYLPRRSSRAHDELRNIGETKPASLDKNVGTADIGLAPTNLAEIDRLAPLGVASGTRYPVAQMHSAKCVTAPAIRSDASP